MQYRTRLILLIGLMAPSLVLAGVPSRFHDFAQVADGGGNRTVFLLMNQTASPVTATLDFFADDGSPLSLTIGTTTGSTFQINVPAGGMTKVATAGTAATAQAGWAQLKAPVEIGAQELFEFVHSNGKLITQAAVESPGPLSLASLFVEKTSGTETGVALASLATVGDTLVRLTLKDENGVTQGTTDITLVPHGHLARLLSQLFPSFSGRGILEVTASGSISVVALQVTGLVLGTLPVVEFF